MTLRGENMVIADSVFAGLQSFGNAAMIFAASNVTFINSTFVNSNNSAGKLIKPCEKLTIALKSAYAKHPPSSRVESVRFK